MQVKSTCSTLMPSTWASGSLRIKFHLDPDYSYLFFSLLPANFFPNFFGYCVEFSTRVVVSVSAEMGIFSLYMVLNLFLDYICLPF